ncbi:MAG: glycosyltransferase family 39 protein [Vicinamibacteria bacterium]
MRPLRVLCLALACLALAAAATAAWRQGWTYDERFHLDWSLRLLDEGVGERSSAARFNSKTPVVIPNVLARRFAREAGAGPEGQRFAARLPTLAGLGLLLLASFLVGRASFGEAAGLLACAGLALDPNLVAHGSLVTVDAVYALANLLALGAALALARRPDFPRAALLGLALGLALATKFSALLLAAGLLALPFCRPSGAPRVSRARGAALALAAAAVALLVLNAAYLFLEIGRPLAQIGLRSGPLRALADAAPPLRLPLPAAFLTGLDASLASERDWGPVVLLGQKLDAGASWYFVALWALKTPLAALAAQLLGLALLLRARRLLRDPACRLLAVNLLLNLLYFSLLFRAQIGYRFVLQCLPFAWLLSGAGLAPLLERRPGRGLGAAVAVSAMSLASVIPYWGNPLAYTNLLVQPKREAFRWVADSNLDWGQNRERVAGWLAERGIPEDRLDPVHLLPGSIVFSANVLAGVFDFEQHRFVRDALDPTEHLGFTYFVYDVELGQFDRFLNDERTLLAADSAGEGCREAAERELLPRGSLVPFERGEPPTGERLSLACVSAPGGADILLRVEQGRVGFGRLRGGRCLAETVGAGQSAFWRLLPGTHALCLLESPYRRARLAYRLRAKLVVRRAPAAVSFEPR